jgi:transketolase
MYAGEYEPGFSPCFNHTIISKRMNTYKLSTGKANLEIFSKTLIELASEDKNLYVVTSDSRGSGKLVPFGEKFPDQLVEVGIAEQNLVGVSAGLASTGKKVFAVSPACFLTTRSLEQIKNDVAYSDIPVTLAGISAGVSYGALGSTHHSIHDVAVLRAIPNIDILVPADNFETREAVIAAAQSKKPVYLKFGKKAMPILPRIENSFETGKASIICQGRDVSLIACGETVAPAYEAALILQEQGISAEVISMHTIKPLDTKAIIHTARKCRAVITAEEHSVHGGLGEACAALLMKEKIYVPFEMVGIPDEDTVTGSQDEIFTHYGISGKGLAEKAMKCMNQK